MDIHALTDKYVRPPIPHGRLFNASHLDPLGRAITGAVVHAASELLRIEESLRATAASLHRAADRATGAVSTPAGKPVPILNSLGELQHSGMQFDSLIAQRESAITHLRAVAALWHLHASTRTTGPAHPASGTHL